MFYLQIVSSDILLNRLKGCDNENKLIIVINHSPERGLIYIVTYQLMILW